MHDNLLLRSLSLGVKEMNAAPSHSKRIKELVCACSSKVQHLRPFVTEYFLLERGKNFVSCRRGHLLKTHVGNSSFCKMVVVEK